MGKVGRGRSWVNVDQLDVKSILCFAPACVGADTFDGLRDGELLTRIVPITLPGRGRRFKEVPVADIHLVADQLAADLIPDIDPGCYLYGHSMGGMLAFEFARRCVAAGKVPGRVILGATLSPALWPAEQLKVSHLPSEELVTFLTNLGFVPAHWPDTLVEAVLPSVRADLVACETYKCGEFTRSLPVDIITVSGRSDRIVDSRSMSGWARYTSRTYKHVEVDGDHMFHLLPNSGLANILVR